MSKTTGRDLGMVVVAAIGLALGLPLLFAILGVLLK
jgi:hypothetical protein